ncbi:MAG: hypothetical protein OEU26_18520 [Candidatus Tectomicrobia bacterium]|nr:hypothetical protein [Candidatus Tectomicrobia bacterium]
MTSARGVRLGVNFEPEDLVGWYHATSGSDIAITISCRTGTVQISRRQKEQVFWWPEGGRGVTEPLEKAVSRLQMLRDTCDTTCYKHRETKRFAPHEPSLIKRADFDGRDDVQLKTSWLQHRLRMP